MMRKTEITLSKTVNTVPSKKFLNYTFKALFSSLRNFYSHLRIPCFLNLHVSTELLDDNSIISHLKELYSLALKEHFPTPNAQQLQLEELVDLFLTPRE